jgi:tetratricopeptide (TPR) repeat protein
MRYAKPVLIIGAVVVLFIAFAGYEIFQQNSKVRPTISRTPLPQTDVAGDAAVHLRRGDAAFDASDYPSAVAEYTQAITLDPNFAEGYNNRGLAYYRLSDRAPDQTFLDKAITDYNSALQLRPDYVNALTNRAIARLDKGDVDGAIADTTRAIELDPQDDSAYMFLGNAFHRKGNWFGAMRNWLQANAIRAERKANGNQ